MLITRRKIARQTLWGDFSYTISSENRAVTTLSLSGKKQIISSYRLKEEYGLAEPAVHDEETMPNKST